MSAENKVLLNINSADRVSGTNTSFDINIASAQLEPKSVEFLSFESPASFYNITNDYNKFVMMFFYQVAGQPLPVGQSFSSIPYNYSEIRTVAGGQQASPTQIIVVSIPPGSYTGQTLASALLLAIQAHLDNSNWYYKTTVKNSFSITYDSNNYKISLSSTDAMVAWWVYKSFSFFSSTFPNTMYNKLGFSDSQANTIYIGSMTSAGVTDLSQIPVIYIYARGLSNNSTINSKGDNMDLLFKVQNNASYGNWIFQTNYSPGMARINITKPLDHIYIQLRDQQGNILVSNSEWSMTVVCYS
jgi:hypothetical protein